MDNEVIYNKIESLRNCIQRIENKKPFEFETLLDDYDLQDVICLNLERSVQLCVDIAAHIISDSDAKAPDTMSDSFTTLKKLNYITDDVEERMIKAVGFRNIAVHTYQDIDWEIVYSIVTKNLNDFVQFAKEVNKILNLNTDN